MKKLWTRLKSKSGSNGRLWLFALILIGVPALAIAGIIPTTKAMAIRAVFALTKYRAAISSLIKLARFETNDFKSSLYVKDHNLWGMGIAKVRPQVFEGVNEEGEMGRPTAIYASDYQSAKDMLLWLEYHKTEMSAIKTDKEFLNWLYEKSWWGTGVDRRGAYLDAFNQW